MYKPLFEIHGSPVVPCRRTSLFRILGLAAVIACSVLLPFYLLDGLSDPLYTDGLTTGKNSIISNAVRFYTGHDALTDSRRFIAIVTYIGLPEEQDPGDVKPAVEEIMKKHVTPAFKKKGVNFEYSTNDITHIRLYYTTPDSHQARKSVTVVCLVSSIGAFALVIA